MFSFSGENVIAGNVAPLVASYLDSHSLIALANTCRTYRHGYAPIVEKRKAAHQLLNAAMNGDLETLDQIYQVCQTTYKNAAWELLLTPTVGTEQHNQRRFEHISCITYAVYAGDFTVATSKEHGDSYLLNHVLAWFPAEKLPYAIKQITQSMLVGTEHGPILRPYQALLDQLNTHATIIANSRNRKDSPVEKVKVVKPASLYVGRAQKQLPKFGLIWHCNEHADWRQSPSTADCHAGGRTPKVQKGNNLVDLDVTLLGNPNLLFHARDTNYSYVLSYLSDDNETKVMAHMIDSFIKTQNALLHDLLDQLVVMASTAQQPNIK